MIVRFLSPARLDDGEAGAAELLDPDEQARAQAFRHGEDRRAYIAAHALLRATLSESMRNVAGSPSPPAWRFVRGAHGKPALGSGQTARDVRFNLSHSRGLVAVAIAEGVDVGIDVEDVERRISDDVAIARRHFTPAEQDYLGRFGDPAQRRRAFLALWTAKEAFIKATGRGLSMPLESFCVDLDACRYARIASSPGVAGLSWTLARWTTSTHLVALAVGNPESPGAPRIECREVSWDPAAQSFRAAARSMPPAACTTTAR